MMILRNIFTLIFLSLSVTGYSQNYVSTYAGNGSPGFVNGTVNSATFNAPFGLCIDKFNNLYVADANNNCIRKINTSTGIVSTLAGTGVAGWKDGPADSALFKAPSDLCIDDSGNVYVSDFSNQRIRKISSDGSVSTIAGNGIAGFADGNGASAEFNYPRGICIDTGGNLYIGDSWNHRIRKIDVSGIVSTYAGGGSATGVGSMGSLLDASDTSARFYTPAGLSIDKSGNIYVADAYNHRIRRIDTSRGVTTVAGSGATGVGNGNLINGSIASARFNTPTEVFVDTANNDLYISDTFNNRIRKVDALNGIVTTYAGYGITTLTDSIDSLAGFNYPRGIVVTKNPVMKVFVNDYNNHAVRLITDPNIGISESESPENNIFIYPNPSADIISISGLGNNYRTIVLYDDSGIKRKEIKILHENNFNIDLSYFTDGIYFLRLIDRNEKSIIRKIIKN